MNRSIVDIEEAIPEIFGDTSGIIRFVESITLNESVSIVNYNGKNLKKELYRETASFKNNTIGILDKLLVFYYLNRSLQNEIETEYKLLEN